MADKDDFTFDEDPPGKDVFTFDEDSPSKDEFSFAEDASDKAGLSVDEDGLDLNESAAPAATPDQEAFTFDEDETFAGSEPDLSSVFADGEQVSAEPEPVADKAKPKFGFGKSKQPKAKKEKPPKVKKEKASTGEGSSPSRILLLILLLLVAAGGGAYYFMDLGGTSPEIPTPAPRAQQSVTLPPKPAPVATPAKPAPTAVQVKPAPAATKEQPAPVSVVDKPVTPGTAEKVAAPPATAGKATALPVPSPAAKSEPADTPAPAKKELPPTIAKRTEAKPAPVAVAPSPATAAAPQTVVNGPFMLEAGAFLIKSDLAKVEQKVRDLGFEPQITPVEAKVKMLRLSLGTFSQDEVQAALTSAQQLSPGAFSLHKGSGYAVYAGSFAKQENLQRLQAKYEAAGIKTKVEPVEITRTLSQVRFGDFADPTAAESAARKAEQAGLTVQVVKGR